MKLASTILMVVFLSENILRVQMHDKNTDDDNSVDTFSKCYEELGCVETNSRWYDGKLRPVNLPPGERHIIKTDFLLIKINKTNKENLLYNNMIAKMNSISSAGYINNSDVIILVHDFTANGYTGWIKHLAKIVLDKHPNTNIISVDWQRGAEPPYDQAISNARVVALEVVFLLRELKVKGGTNFDKIHIIGHGVGAHIAGYVGATFNNIKKITGMKLSFTRQNWDYKKQLNHRVVVLVSDPLKKIALVTRPSTNLQTIYGLDPSGPRFEGMPDVVKLNPANAKYVEIIHTDAFNDRSQGTQESMGHSDFYINNALEQPDCPVNTTFPTLISIERNSLNGGEISPGCSHKRAFKYYIEALSGEECVFLGIKCNSFADFKEGKCSSCEKSNITCRTFGLITYKNSGEKISYYLNTDGHPPYCMFVYKVTIYVKGEGTHHGSFDFILVDNTAHVAESTMADPRSNMRDFKGGQPNVYVYYVQPPKLSKLKEAKVRWTKKKKLYCILFCKESIDVEKIVFKYLGSGQNDEGEEENMCPKSKDTVIENGAYSTFVSCNSLEDQSTQHSTDHSTKESTEHPTKLSTGHSTSQSTGHKTGR